MRQNRRQFLATAGAASTALWLAACGGDSDSGGGGSTSGGGGGGDLTGNITFTTWGTPAEIATYKRLIAGFEQEHAGAKVTLRELPFEEIKQNIDAGLEADKAPDVFRVTYQDVGFYSTRNALLNLGDFLPDGFSDAFIPGLWSAIVTDDVPYGVPLHADVSAVIYNKSLVKQAGIANLPTRLDAAWTWDEFLDASRRIKSSSGKYGHAYNWQLAGSYRWLNLLYQAGGQMIDDEATRATLVTPEGTKALEFIKTWVDEELFPPATGPKGGYPDEIFPAGTFGLLFGGDFLLASLSDTVRKFEFGAMPMPRDAAAATDLGGNALVGTAATGKPALTAKFLEYMASEPAMKQYCEEAGTLPTRTALAEQRLDYQVTPELFPIFTQQATTLGENLVKASTLPDFTRVNNVFTEELEKLVRSGQDVQTTLEAMNAGVQESLQA